MIPSQRLFGRALPGGFIGIGIMLALVLLVSGCTQQSSTLPVTPTVSVATPAPTAMVTATMAEGGKRMFTFTEADNGKAGDIAHNTRFAITLAENPTTGFMWNASLSPGLELQSSDYSQNEAPSGMTGVGGIHTWFIVAKNPGEQKFSASYQRSWEPVTGKETAYNVTINVVTV